MFPPLLVPAPSGARPRRRAAAHLIVLALASASALAQPLTLEAAQHAALHHSAQLHGKAAAIGAALAQAEVAGERPDPLLKAGIDNIPASGADRATLGTDSMTMRRVGVMQELTRGDKLRLRSERYRREAGRLQAERDAARATIERETAVAWLDLRFAQTELELHHAEQAALRDQRTATESAYRGGRLRRAELLALDAELAALDEHAIVIAQRVRTATLALGRWTGDGAPTATGPLPDLAEAPLDAATVDQLSPHLPALLVLDRKRGVSETDASLAAAARRPDWSVEITFQQRGPAYSNMVSFGVSVPLQWDRPHRQDKELAARLAQADQARDEYEEARRATLTELRQALDAWQSGRQRLDQFRRTLIPLAREREDAVLSDYRGGKASLAEVLGARRRAIEVRQQALQVEAEVARTWARLRFQIPTLPAQEAQ